MWNLQVKVSTLFIVENQKILSKVDYIRGRHLSVLYEIVKVMNGRANYKNTTNKTWA